MATDYTQDANCKGAWFFTENTGTSVNDSSSQNNDLTLLNSAWVSGTSIYTYGVEGNASGEYLYSGTAVRTALGALSVVMHANVSNPQPSTYAGRLCSERNNRGWMFACNSDNAIRFFWQGTTSLSHISNNSAITRDTWEHYAVTYDGSTTAANAKIYVNGAEVSYQTTTNGSALLDPDGATYFFGEKNLDAQTRIYAKITGVGIFNDVLSSTEINDIMDNGLDGSGGAAATLYPFWYMTR